MSQPLPAGSLTATPSPVLQVEDVDVDLGGRRVLGGVSGSVAAGEFVGIIGPNGAGKSTLLRAILGLIRPARGRIMVLGQPAGRGNVHVGYCPQIRGFDRDLPIAGRDLVGLGLDGHRWGPGWPSRERRARIDAAIAEVGAQTYADAPIGQLSGGEQQRLMIAQALLAQPRLLLLDEPLASLDLHSQREIVDLVAGLAHEHRLAVLFVTHGLNQLMGVLDRVWYLAGGRAAMGTLDEVVRSDVLSRLYGSPVEVFRAGNRVFVTTVDEGGEEH